MPGNTLIAPGHTVYIGISSPQLNPGQNQWQQGPGILLSRSTSIFHLASKEVNSFLSFFLPLFYVSKCVPSLMNIDEDH